MELVQAIPQPVIAMVRGIATAAGCQLAATCDLVVAEEGAKFGTPGVKIGLFCSTPMVALSRVIGQKRAMQMLLTGLPITRAPPPTGAWSIQSYPPISLRTRPPRWPSASSRPAHSSSRWANAVVASSS